MKPQPGEHPLKRNYKRESNNSNPEADQEAVDRRRRIEHIHEMRELRELGITEEDME